MRITFKNPQYGNVSAKQFGYSIPNEGELFREGSYSGSPNQYKLFKRQNGRIAPVMGTTLEGDQRPVYLNTKTNQIYTIGRYGGVKQLGKAPSGIRGYNMADISQAMRSNLRQQSGLTGWNRQGIDWQTALKGFQQAPKPLPATETNLTPEQAKQSGLKPIPPKPANTPEAKGLVGQTTPRQVAIARLKKNLLNIQSGLSGVSKQLQPLAQAKKAGMKITPQTTVEQAKQYLGNQHHIQRGETLSGIAKQYGTDVNTLLKANPQIKNPNLIYAGSTLNIPTQTPQTTTAGIPTSNITPTTAGTPTPPPTTTYGGGTTGSTTAGGNDYQKFLMNQIAQQNEYLKDYINTLKKQPTAIDTYNQYSQQLGLPQQQKQVAGIQRQVLDTENLLNKLESDINSRISGHLVTEAQRRRELAIEGKPLKKQLADLMRAEKRARSGYSETRRQLADILKMYSQDQSKQEKLAKLPLEYGYKSLPYYSKALTYQSPAEKAKQTIANRLALEAAEKTAGIGRYYHKTTTPPSSYREWQLAGKPGTYADWVKKPTNKNHIKTDTIAKMREYAGTDGYVSPDTYKTLKTAWRRRGYNITVGDFDKLFSSTFVNPTHPQDYGVKTKTKTIPQIK